MSYVCSVRTAAVALAAGLAVGLAGTVHAQAITVDNVGEMVQEADTAAEHSALADYFRAQASQAKDMARKHRAMLVTAPAKSARKVWNAHCKRLIQSYEAEAAAYLDLSEEQGMLAKHAAVAR